jgi:hypothetical protein
MDQRRYFLSDTCSFLFSSREMQETVASQIEDALNKSKTFLKRSSMTSKHPTENNRMSESSSGRSQGAAAI